MDAQKWQVIKQIFSQACERELSEQGAFIEQACKGDDETLQQVKQMLEVENERSLTPDVNNTFDNIITASATDMLTDVSALSAGDIIEHFEVLRSIGEGGMGSVYLAKRIDNDFEQLVAIKVIHSKHITEKSMLRFRQERQILASLNHKNIASFIGGGETTQGQPYIILEYVDGVPITEYCQAQNLSVSARVDLFKQVIDAVTFAHQNLVVHRDIKPNNVLVNSSGEIKLLDFGIAKLVHDDSQQNQPANAQLTQEFARVLTPANASPEQVVGAIITTRSDVYGLGALLMFLVTDEAVFDTTASSQLSIQSMILDTQPVRPSSKCLASNKTHLKKRASTLKGDLDTIVMKALQKDPERRYSSAEQFMEDILRHQNNYPILAKPDSLLYRVSKFVKRNTLSTALGTILFVGLAGASVVIMQQSFTIQAERDTAIQQAFIAQETAEFMTNIFDAADPSNNDGEEISVRSLVDQAASDLASNQSNGIIKAQLSLNLAKVYSNLGEFETASKMVENAEALFNAATQELGDEEQSSLGLSIVYQKGNILISLGQYEQAIEYFKVVETAATTLNHKALSENDKDTYYVWANTGLATALGYLGQESEAIAHQKAALARAEKVIKQGGKSASLLLKTMPVDYISFGHSLRRTGDFEQSKIMILRGIELEKSSKPEGSVNLAYGFNQLASTLLQLNQLDEAERYAKQGLDIRLKILGDAHVESLASVGMLSNIYTTQKNFAKAIEMRKKMLSMMEKSLGAGHPFYPQVQLALGKMLSLDKQYESAKEYLNKGFIGLQALYPKGNTKTAIALTALGDLALKTQQNDVAMLRLIESVKIHETFDETPTKAAAETYGLYSLALYNSIKNTNWSNEQEKSERLRLAAEYADRALKVLASFYGIDHPQYQAMDNRIKRAKH